MKEGDVKRRWSLVAARSPFDVPQDERGGGAGWGAVEVVG